MKTTFRCLAVAAALLIGAVAATAQPGPGGGPGPAASAPRGAPMGGPMGGRMGASGPMGGSGPMAGRMASGPMPGRMASAPMGGYMMGGRSGSDYTPGWTLMTRQERREHQAKMRDVKTRAECEALRDEHHKLMEQRAKEKDRTLPAQPRRDPCAGLK